MSSSDWVRWRPDLIRAPKTPYEPLIGSTEGKPVNFDRDDISVLFAKPANLPGTRTPAPRVFVIHRPTGLRIADPKPDDDLAEGLVRALALLDAALVHLVHSPAR
jgi:hypothetical protein